MTAFSKSEEQWHDVAGMVTRAVRAHSEALVLARTAAGMDDAEARDSVRRYGDRLAAAVRKAIDAGTRQAVLNDGGDA